jgi:hypothetical protein
MTPHTHPACITYMPTCPACIASIQPAPKPRKVKAPVIGKRANRWHTMCSRCQSRDIVPELSIQWNKMRKHHYCARHADSRATDLELQGAKRRTRRARRTPAWWAARANKEVSQ